MKKWNKFLILFNIFIFIPLFFIFIYHYLYVFCVEEMFGLVPFSVFFTFIIIECLYLVLLGLTGKSNISFFILFIFMFLLFLINQIKIIYMGEPLFFSDFNFVSNTSNIIDVIGNNFFSNVKEYLLFFGILLLSSIVLMIYQLFFKIKISSIKRRILISGVGLLVLFMLFFPFSWSKDLYKDIFFDASSHTDYDSYTDYVSFYSYYGIIGGMYYQMLESRIEIPDNYDEKELYEVLKSVSDEIEVDNIGRPNIIVILSESFFDVNLLSDNIEFDKEITKNFNELKDKGYLLEMISPSYGGMTANVSFELLTGGNMSYFGSGYIPFMQLYNDKKEINSVVSDLMNNGYNTKIFMGNDSYNSRDLFMRMGFLEYVEIEENTDNVKGEWVSDDYIADMIISDISKDSDKKFIMVETMQSHMDYFKNKYENYDISIKNSNLSNDDSDILLSYAQGIHDADKMLKKVYDYIESIEEDTILIFFGDHLPYLRSLTGNNIINKLDYFNTNDELLNLYRLYNTEALILSNYDVDLNFLKKDYLGIDLLLSSLISQMDIEVNSYYKWLYSTKDKLPSYNRYVFVDKNGNLYNKSELPLDVKNIYQLREKMMYKMLIK